jgi:hypothetical protein
MSALLTATEIAMQKSARAAHIIPPITNPLGKHWNQPLRTWIEIDDTHAMMPREAFDQLLDYTQSQPSGVYPGKMWKVRRTSNDSKCPQCSKGVESIISRLAEAALLVADVEGR